VLSGLSLFSEEIYEVLKSLIIHCIRSANSDARYSTEKLINSKKYVDFIETRHDTRDETNFTVMASKKHRKKLKRQHEKRKREEQAEKKARTVDLFELNRKVERLPGGKDPRPDYPGSGPC